MNIFLVFLILILGFIFFVYKIISSKKSKVDSYGCGDSFAAGILYGMASKWDIDKSLNLAKVMGRDASEFFGPYAKKWKLIDLRLTWAV